jgi:hypothetical protein
MLASRDLNGEGQGISYLTVLFGGRPNPTERDQQSNAYNVHPASRLLIEGQFINGHSDHYHPIFKCEHLSSL